MTGLAQSLALLSLAIWLWIECRLLAGRTTMGASKFLLVFGVGAIGATVCALVIERLALVVMPAATASFTVGPAVEELAKAAPLLFIGFWAIESKRLTIADLALMGVSIGLGFQLVESMLQTIATGLLPPFVTPLVFGWVGVTDHVGGTSIFDVGHAVSTGLVGLAIGVGVRALRSVGQAQLLTAGTFAVVLLDHAVFDWKVGHKVTHAGAAGVLLSFPTAPKVIESIYAITGHGAFEVALLAVGLVAANWFEGVRQWQGLAWRGDVLLPTEPPHSGIVDEWLTALRGLKSSLSQTVEALTFFRHRRAYALARSLDPTPNSSSNGGRQPYVATLENRTLQERARLTEWERDSERSVSRSLRVGALGLMRTFPVLLIVALVIIVGFAVLRLSGRISYLYARPIAIILALGALAFAGWRLWTFRRQPTPNPTEADGETLAGHHMRGLLSYCSVAVSGIAVVVWFLPKSSLSPTAGLAFMLGALDQWIAATGGSPSSLLALGGFASPGGDDCNCCAAERAAVEAGKASLAQRATELARLREESVSAQQGLDKAKGNRADAQGKLRTLDNESYVESTEGRLAGVRLTSTDLRRQRADEAHVRAQLASGQITQDQAQAQLAKWADPEYIKSVGQQGEQDRQASRAVLQQQLASAQAAEASAQEAFGKAMSRLKAARLAAAAEQGGQDEREMALADCEGGPEPQTHTKAPISDDDGLPPPPRPEPKPAPPLDEGLPPPPRPTPSVDDGLPPPPRPTPPVVPPIDVLEEMKKFRLPNRYQQIIDQIKERIAHVNPSGSDTNCFNCAWATDHMLSGIDMEGTPSPGWSLDRINAFLKDRLDKELTQISLVDLDHLMEKAGPDSQGIVIGIRDDHIGHAFNVVNRGGYVIYPDGQIGDVHENLWEEGFTKYYYVRTR